ncbi:TolC family protein [Desulfobacterales bacterium HSG16]|nr:TolC family protein [Desulfobacterales bacterium HSG16]
MVEKSNKIKEIFLRPAVLNALVLACMIGLLCSCVHVPSKQEMEQDRVTNAQDDVEILKPGTEINFEDPLSLTQVIKIGLKYNLKLRIDRLNREIADKNTLAEKLRMLPSLKAGAGISYRDKLRRSDVYDWQDDRDLPDTTVSELKDSLNADLTLTWSVLDTVLASVRSGQYELKEEILEQRMVREEQQLALDITSAYWQAAAVEDAIDYVKHVETKLKDIKTRIDESVKNRSLDMMVAADAELRLKELELTFQQLKANLSSSRLELSRLMGMNQNVQYTLERPPILPIVKALPHTQDLDIDSLEEYALLHRPELFESDLQLLIQREDAKSAVLSMFPGLSFFAATHYDDNRLLLSNTWNSVGAGIGWELLELPSKYVEYKGRKKAIDVAHHQRLMMTIGVITQVHIALLDYAIKVDRFRLLEETFGLSDKLLNMAKTKYNANKLPAMAVTQRHLEKMAAKLRRDEAVVDLLVAHKRLCVSLGVSPLDCDQGVLPSGKRDYVSDNAQSKRRWQCSSCNYIHTGATPPEQCPVCSVDKSKFFEIDAESYEPKRAEIDEDINLKPEFRLDSSDADGEDLDSWGSSRSLPQPDVAGSNSLYKKGSARGFSGNAADKYLWKVQLGSFVAAGGPDKRIEKIKDLDMRFMDSRDARISTFRGKGRLFNRVRVLGLTQKQAKGLDRQLKAKGMESWIIPPSSTHW